MSRDIAELRVNVSLAETAVHCGLKLEQDGHEFVSLCPFHAEDTPSFTIFAGRDGVERFHCFGCGERGDVVDFIQKIKCVDASEAIKILGGGRAPANVKPKQIKARDIYAGIEPVEPKEELQVGKQIRLYNPKRAGEEGVWGSFTPSMVHPYRNEAGALLGYVLRRNLPDGKKETPMVMRVRLPDGKECWSRYPFPKPRPLYRLDKIGVSRQIIIVEGEKCADALGSVFANRSVVSWAGGTYGINHADWSAIAGRSVVIWPDADEPGLKTANEIAARLVDLGCRVFILALNLDDHAKGWDCADAVDQGWDADQIEKFMRAHVREWKPPVVEQSVEPEPEHASAVVEQKPVVEYDDGFSVFPDRLGPDMPIEAFDCEPWCRHPLREWVFITAENAFYNYKTAERMPKASFDLAMKRVSPTVYTFDKDGNPKTEKLAPSVIVTNRMNGHIVSGVMYRPDISDLFFSWEGSQWVNSFLPESVTKADPDWRKHDAWRACRDHILRILPEGGEYLIKWLAYNVQKQGQRINWAPVIVGPEGCGKTIIVMMLKAAMGRRNVQVIGEAALFSDFTGWAEGSCVRVMEEIRIQGERRTTVMNKLKPYITNETVEVVNKGKDPREILNVTNYIALTNFPDALAVTEGDRRWCIWSVIFQKKEEADRALGGEAYFAPLWDAVNNHGDVIRGWLMSVDVSDFNPHIAPAMTDAKRTMIELSRSPLDADMREALAIGGFGIGKDVVVTKLLSNAMKEIGGRLVNTTTMANLMRECGWVRFDGTIKWKNETRRVYYRPEAVPEGYDGDGLVQWIKLKLDETASENSSDYDEAAKYL